MIKRYDFHDLDCMGSSFIDGEYVLYSDHIAKVAELEAKYNEHKELLRKQCNRTYDLQAKLDKAILTLKFAEDKLLDLKVNGLENIEALITETIAEIEGEK